MDELILHEMHSSGNCYKVRLTAALLDIRFTALKEYNVMKGETRTPEYTRTVNANGRIPVLQIGPGTFLPESSAACYYLADASHLIPADRLERAEMLRWMFFEQYSHEPYVATLRFWMLYVGLDNLSDEQKVSLASKRTQGHAALEIMDKHLSTRQFMVAERITLADIVLYAYTDGARKMKPAIWDFAQYPSVVAWCERIATVPGYITMEE